MEKGSLKIEWISPGELKGYPKNSKIHDAKQIANVANSIKRFGWQQPLVIDDAGVVVIGHCRLLAAKKLGLKTVPVTVASGLTEDEIRELRIADNKTNESPWDFELLQEDLEGLEFEGFDFDFDRFSDDEKVEISEDGYDKPLPEEPKSKLGEVYQLGMHCLICGDCRDIAAMDALMDGAKADLVVTDPPYNMAYEGAGNTRDRDAKRIMNDSMPEKEFEQFLQDAYGTYSMLMKDGASIYVFYKELGNGVFMRKMRDAGLTYKQELVWVKSQLVLGGSKYQSMYEPCLMGCKGKTIKIWNGGRTQRSVIEDIDFMGEEELRSAIKDLLTERDDLDVIREKKQIKNDLHPTMKPIRLLAKMIQNSSCKGDVVADLFGGSGSTLIACEQLGRRCYMSELDPRYVDVIIDRWETFTGGKAVLLNG